MTANLLITGQIRNQDTLLNLAKTVASMGDEKPRVVFATWTEEIIKAGSMIEEMKGYGIEVIDCGSALPLNATLNRDLKSFLAQYQQIACGLSAFDVDGHVIRIRADLLHPERLPGFIKAITDSVAMFSLADRSIVLGTGWVCPYFIEDRAVALCKRHRDRLLYFSFNDILSYDAHNLFPEFLFYTIMAKAPLYAVNFEYKYGEKTDHMSMVKYRQNYFGRDYSRRVFEYMAEFESNFVFFNDVASAARPGVEMPPELIPSSYNVTGLDHFKAAWTGIANGVRHEDQSSESHDREQTVQWKRLLFSIELKYVSGKNSDLIEEFNAVRDYGCFQSRANELCGCSFGVVGNHRLAYDYLFPLFEGGWRSYELMYYLTIAAKETDQKDSLSSISSAFTSAFPGNKHVADHVAALIAC